MRPKPLHCPTLSDRGKNDNNHPCSDGSWQSAAGGRREHALNAPRSRHRVTRSQEFQSGLVRLAAWLVMAVFVGIGGAEGHYSISWQLYAWLFGVHLVWFTALLVDVIRRPALRPWRTRIAVLADLSAITLLIYLSGALLAPFFLVYILSFLSQGSRYGRTNLVIASVGSVIAYSVVATVMGGWQNHAFEVVFILAALVVLPLYQDALLRNLQSARRRAEAANAARGDFLATMSHELRTPLSGMLGTARLLRNTDLDAEQRRCVDSLCASGETLQALIGDILDLSKVDAGSLELHHDHFDLRQSLLDVCRNLGQEALAKRVELVCCIDGSLPQSVHGDRVRFEQILYNLVGNAVKFTPAGRVCVEAERAAPHADLAIEHLEIVIGDTGIGIPRERLDCIFDSFWQADTRTSRHHGGTGLGTTIAHRLTRAMGGHITADSEENRGTTFRVRLPFLPDAADDRPPQPPSELNGRRVLVYEGDPESRSALEDSCRQAGMEVVSCSEETELDQQLAALDADATFDLALVADSPAGIDLDATAGRICRRLGAQVPLLYVGYGSRLAVRDPSRVAGVAKPWHPSEIWGAMARALEIGPVRSGDGEAGAPAAAEPAPPGDEARRVLVIEDDTVNAEIVRTLLGRSGYAVVIEPDGASGLARIDGEAFDLLLVDLRMPGMDGVEFTRRVRAREDAGDRVPIVALTATASAEARSEALSAGMDAFLTKPVDADRLEDLIRELAPA